MHNEQDQYMTIIETNSKNIIVQGRISSIKEIHGHQILDNEDQLISIDNKHFFHRAGTKHYSTLITKKEVPIKKNDISNLISEQWRTHANITKEIDIYIDNDMNGLDEEIRDLVYTLNNIDSIATTSSCSGHNIDSAYITFKIYDLFIASRIFLLLQDIDLKLFQDWYIDCKSCTVYSSLKNKWLNDILKERPHLHICLRTFNPGYTQIEKLNIVLETFINNGFFNLKNKDWG